MVVVLRNFDLWFDGKLSFSVGDGGALMEVKGKEEEEVRRNKGRMEC